MKELTYQDFTTAVAVVTAQWNSAKVITTKADKQLMLIINSKHTFASMINAHYDFGGTTTETLEQHYNSKQFAKDVVSRVMEDLLF